MMNTEYTGQRYMTSAYNGEGSGIILPTISQENVDKQVNLIEGWNRRSNAHYERNRKVKIYFSDDSFALSEIRKKQYLKKW